MPDEYDCILAGLRKGGGEAAALSLLVRECRRWHAERRSTSDPETLRREAALHANMVGMILKKLPEE